MMSVLFSGFQVPDKVKGQRCGIPWSELTRCIVSFHFAAQRRPLLENYFTKLLHSIYFLLNEDRFLFLKMKFKICCK